MFLNILKHKSKQRVKTIICFLTCHEIPRMFGNKWQGITGKEISGQGEKLGPVFSERNIPSIARSWTRSLGEESSSKSKS